MTTYNPDKWALVSVAKKRAPGNPDFKILGSWYGGFAGSNSWKLSSGVEKIFDKGTYYEVHNYSGSIYNCHKEAQGMSLYTHSVFTNWVEMAKDEAITYQIEMIEDLKDSGVPILDGSESPIPAAPFKAIYSTRPR